MTPTKTCKPEEVAEPKLAYIFNIHNGKVSDKSLHADLVNALQQSGKDLQVEKVVV